MRFVFFVMVGLVGVRYHLVLREMERLIVEQGEGRRGEARGSNHSLHGGFYNGGDLRIMVFSGSQM